MEGQPAMIYPSCRFKLYALVSATVSLLLLFPMTQSWAQLPNLGASKSLSGASSAAEYFAGSQRNSTGRSGFDTSFTSSDTLIVSAEIHPDPLHVGNVGNLYIVARVDSQLYMRDESGNYIQWDGNTGSLQATASNKPLQAIEHLEILNNASVGKLGIEGKAPQFYFGYNLGSDPTELYYHDQPLSFTVASYDPLFTSGMPIRVDTTTIEDQVRNRQIPILVYLPESASPRPVILFSHGLGGNLRAATYLGMHWAARGYVAVFLQHPGSDETILDGVPPINGLRLSMPRRL